MAGKYRKHLIRFFRLLGINARMDLNWLLYDTRYTLLGMLTDLLANISMLGGVFLVALRFGGIGGLSYNEVLFMLSYNTMVTGLYIMFCSTGNNGHVSRIIGRGQLEHMFIQPLPLGTQLVTMGFAPCTGCGNFLAGVLLLCISLSRLGLPVTAGWVAWLVFYLLVTLVIILAHSYLFASAAFYAPVAAEEISTFIIDGGGYISSFPLSGMPRRVQAVLLTILPAGLQAWYPSLVLLGKAPHIEPGKPGIEGFAALINMLAPLYPPLFALLLVLVASYIFRKGLRYYVVKGSNRYLPYGFRR